MTAIEELQTAVNALDMIIEIAKDYGSGGYVSRAAVNARNNVLRALDELDTTPAEICFDNDAIKRMIEAAGVEYRRSVFM